MQTAIRRKWMDGANSVARKPVRRRCAPVAILVTVAIAIAAVAIWALRPSSGEAENGRRGESEKMGKVEKGNRKKSKVKEVKNGKRRRTNGEYPAMEQKPAAGSNSVAGEKPAAGEKPMTNETEEVEDMEKPLFRHGAEQLLVMATPSDPGGYVPPLPEITEESVAEDLSKAMKSVIAPAPGDTERTLEMKLNVAGQKEEFRDLRASGMKFTEYVNALREKFNDDAEYLAEARRLDETLFTSPDVSDKDYEEYRKELNKNLRERGLPELEKR